MSKTNYSINLTNDSLSGNQTISVNNDSYIDDLSFQNISDAVHNQVIEGNLSNKQLLKIFLAVLAGQTVGGGSANIEFKGNDGITTRITATVDVNGNRSLVVLNGN